MNNREKNKIKRRESAPIDQILKLLFCVSKQMMVDTLNGLFGEDFSPEDVEIDISKTATEFVSNNLDMIRADLFLKLMKSKKPRHYHVEF